MNFQYHRKTLIASEIDHPYVITALTMLDTVEQAMKDLVEGKIDIPKYINAITPYDKFLLEKFYEKPQKSNPINTFQNKSILPGENKNGLLYLSLFVKIWRRNGRVLL